MLANLVPSFKVVSSLVPSSAGSLLQRKRTIIRALLEPLRQLSPAKVEDLVDELVNREAKSSTAMGRGIAIPHARTVYLERPALVVGLCDQGLAWGGEKGDSVTVLFLILVPSDDGRLYLQILNRLSSLVRLDGFVSDLRRCSDENSALEIIHSYELRLKLRVS